MKDFIFNHYLSVKNFLMHIFKIKPTPSFKNRGEAIFHIFDDMSFEELKSKYIFSQSWGNYHPDDLKQWYDKNCTSLSRWGLELSISDRLFRIPNDDKNGNGGKYINTGVGICVSKESYLYGLFEWNITLPDGAQLWPAIWLTGEYSWPPEIDALEGYSNDKAEYSNRLNTNAYFANKLQIGAMSHGFLINKEKSLNIKLDRQPKYINIYYNNYLVRRITKENTVSWINTENMVVVMNNAVRKPNANHKSKSPLIIHDFTYIKNK